MRRRRRKGYVFSMTGWLRFWRRRRDALIAVGLDYYEAADLATAEAECRDRIGRVLGREHGKAVKLVSLVDGDGAVRFALVTRANRVTWERLAGIPCLVYPIEIQSRNH